MLGEIESNMKKTFRIKCFKLVLGVSLCFLIYLLVSLIIPPLIGTHEKSDTQAEVLAPGAHSQFGSGKNTQFEPEQRANPFENVFSKTAVFPPPAIAETDL